MSVSSRLLCIWCWSPRFWTFQSRMNLVTIFTFLNVLSSGIITGCPGSDKQCILCFLPKPAGAYLGFSSCCNFHLPSSSCGLPRMFCIHWNTSGTQFMKKRFEWFFFLKTVVSKRRTWGSPLSLWNVLQPLQKYFSNFHPSGGHWRKLAVQAWFLVYACVVGTSKSYLVLTPMRLSFLAHDHFQSFPGFLSIKCLSNYFDLFLLGSEYCEFCENAIMNTGFCFSYSAFLGVSVSAVF